MTTVWEPMLAKPAETLPAAGAMPGGTVYEPKWDGYRGILVRGGDGCRLWSRAGNDLTRCFDDVVSAACEHLSPGTVIDGELVAWKDGRLDFAALAPRLAQRAARRSGATMAPVSFLAFDLLALDGDDLRTQPLAMRRAGLEQLACGWQPPLQLTPQTNVEAEARQWLSDYDTADLGVEGLVAKGASQRYLSGRRGWVKIRIRHTREATVGAVIGPVERPDRLILGLRTSAGELRVAGATHPLTSSQAAELGKALSRAGDEHPWPAELDHRRLGHFSKDPIAITRVRPSVIVEVDADTAFEHGRWRHLTQYRRIRWDLASAQPESWRTRS